MIKNYKLRVVQLANFQSLQSKHLILDFKYRLNWRRKMVVYSLKKDFLLLKWPRLLHITAFEQCDQIWRFIGLWATKPLATMNLPKSPTFLGNFCKGVKICHIYSEIIFGQLL